jgi:signal transduction histidine kinase
METNDLAVSIRTLGEALAAEHGVGAAPELTVEVEGTPRPLHPIVRDEIFRIAGEALYNAYRHARAHRIEVELRYDARQLRLRIRDDGTGIGADVLRAGGRDGHFGLHGMRERAGVVGGKLTVWSAAGSGTEVELSIPASHAYSSSQVPGRSWIAEKLYGQDTPDAP